VLTLQLLRFVYDKNAGHKKKLMHEVAFPEKLEMGPFFSPSPSLDAVLIQPDEATSYLLFAGICHCGPSAHGGHYVAYAYDQERDKWWKFDDDRVSQCKAFPFGKEKNEDVYMLFYRRADGWQLGQDGREELVPPKEAVELVEADTDQVLRSVSQYAEQRTSLHQIVETDMLRYKEIYKNLAVKPGAQEYYWIATDWLKRWISGNEEPGPINNSSLLCDHGNVNLHHHLRKRISPMAWEYFVDKYGGGPALTHSNCCIECTRAWFHDTRAARRATEEKDEILRSCNLHYEREPGFWISKNWFTTWREADPKTRVPISNINFDIICEHGNLTPDETLRRTIPVNAWSYLRGLYDDPTLVEFPSPATKPCDLCREAAKQEKELCLKLRQERTQEKHRFSAVYELKQGYSRLRRPVAHRTYCVVSLAWLQKWWEYIDHPPRPSPGPIDNGPLMCPHGALLYNVEQAAALEDKTAPLDYLSEAAWDDLHSLYGGGPVIKFHVIKSEMGYYPTTTRTIEAITEPAVCPTCFQLRLAQEREALLNFQNKPITVREGNFSWSKKSIRVSCTTTVGTLKLLVYQEMDVPVYQQLLFYGELLLSDDNATLKDYSIVPDAEITLNKVSDPVAAAAAAAAFLSTSQPPESRTEEGFKGTSLTTLPPSVSNSSYSPASSSSSSSSSSSCCECECSSGECSCPTSTGEHNRCNKRSKPLPSLSTPTAPAASSADDPSQLTSPAPKPMDVERSNEWACSFCTFLNDRFPKVCAMCDQAN
jgi:ubiquitin carboxyl-terminal hydrolase 48